MVLHCSLSPAVMSIHWSPMAEKTLNSSSLGSTFFNMMVASLYL